AMTLLDSLASAASSLASNKLRSILTTLGVIIGVASVISMVGIAEGTKKQSLEQLEAMGSNLISVMPNRRWNVAPGATPQTLQMEDVDLIRRSVPTVSAVTGEVRSGVGVKYGSINERSQVTGGLPEIQQIRNVKLKEGRFFTEEENDRLAKVCILGFDIYDRLFGDGTSAIGATVRIDGTDFEVIGIGAFKGGGGFMNPDDMIYAPINTVISRIERRETLSSISVQAMNSDVMPYTLDQVQKTLAKVRRDASGEELFRAFNQGELIETAEEQSRVLSLLLAGVASVSLLVGGIGIMNIMLVSVTERTKEIGLRKALGATKDALLSQFLLESVMLCLLGGAVGVVLGIAGVTFVAGLMGVPPVIVPGGVVIAFGFAALVGIFFGFYPAYLASKLEPIEALRSE
ncbi:MAG: ABC transporter permease, partial [Armatimonadota bacterium]|nr:ABC transporter permease [Armatimonadota bacterium]